MIRFLVFASVACASACASTTGLSVQAQPWPEADELFRHDARFLGADSAYSVSLGGDRVLWLFGDTFVALDATRSRRAAKMVRNSIAIETGTDPSTAHVRFFFGGGEGAPSSFFPSGEDESKAWLWPGTPVLVDGRLMLFFWHMKAVGTGAFGFVLDHTSAVVIDNPTDDPVTWHTAALTLPQGSPGVLGTGGAFVDDATLWLLTAREPGDHQMYATRIPAADAARGDLSRVAVTDAGFRGQTELSIGRANGAFIVVSVDGFGAAPVVVRTAPHPAGPWTEPLHVFDAPEAGRRGTHVYSAKAHPELTGADLVVTYCTNDVDLNALVDDASVYFPRFLKLTLARRKETELPR